MLFTNRISRVALASMGIGCLASLASAQFAVRDLRSFVDAAATSSGGGQGTIHMPTLNEEGLMVGVFVDVKDGTKYMLEATLTAWIPGLIDPQNQVALGGIYGELREYVGQGLLHDAQPALIGRVEGTWRMDRDLKGVYEAFVYESDKTGLEVIAGRIDGQFLVNSMDDAVPAPQVPRFNDASIGKGYHVPVRTKSAVKARRFGDALSNAESAEADPVDQQRKRRAAGLSDARSNADSAGADLVDQQRKRRGTGLSDARSNADSAGADPVDRQRKRRGTGLSDARSERDEAGADLFDTRRKLRSAKLDHAGSGSAGSATSGLGDLGHAGPGPSVKKIGLFGDAESSAPQRIARGIGDAASSGAGGSPLAQVKNALGSAASDPFGTPTNRFGTPTRGEAIVWPVLSGEFRGRYKLID